MPLFIEPTRTLRSAKWNCSRKPALSGAEGDLLLVLPDKEAARGATASAIGNNAKNSTASFNGSILFECVLGEAMVLAIVAIQLAFRNAQSVTKSICSSC